MIARERRGGGGPALVVDGVYCPWAKLYSRDLFDQAVAVRAVGCGREMIGHKYSKRLKRMVRNVVPVFNVSTYRPVLNKKGVWVWRMFETIHTRVPADHSCVVGVLRGSVHNKPLSPAELLFAGIVAPEPIDWRPDGMLPEDYYAL